MATFWAAHAIFRRIPIATQTVQYVLFYSYTTSMSTFCTSIQAKGLQG